MKPIKLIADVEAEDRLLVCMLAAPDSEIDNMLTGVIGEPLDYLRIVANARRQWAEAIIKEASIREGLE